MKLQKNRDWKSVIEEAYFKDEAARLPKALVDDNLQGEVDQRLIDEKIRAIGHLQLFLTSLIQLGKVAEQTIEQEKENAVNETVEYDEISGEPITN